MGMAAIIIDVAQVPRNLYALRWSPEEMGKNNGAGGLPRPAERFPSGALSDMMASVREKIGTWRRARGSSLSQTLASPGHSLDEPSVERFSSSSFLFISVSELHGATFSSLSTHPNHGNQPLRRQR